MDMIKQSELEIELRNPENRRIIQAYVDAEDRRLDKAVYSPLDKRYPSLNIREATIKEEDLIMTLEELKSNIQMLVSLTESCELADLGKGIIDEGEDSQAVKRLWNRINRFSESYGKYVLDQEQFYVHLAYAVKAVSTRRGVGIEETVEDLQYMDEVSRIVHPTRKEAELFLRTSGSCEIEQVDSMRGLLAFLKKTGQADEEMLMTRLSIPTTDAIKALVKATWDYKMQEFDRIYSV